MIQRVDQRSLGGSVMFPERGCPSATFETEQRERPSIWRATVTRSSFNPVARGLGAAIVLLSSPFMSPTSLFSLSAAGTSAQSLSSLLDVGLRLPA